MSEKITRYLLSEIKTIRVVCKKCGGVVEMPILSASDALTSQMTCRFCNADFERLDLSKYDPFKNLEIIAEAFAKMEKVIEVQFVFAGD